MSGKYDDIIHLPHHVSANRARMSDWDRAAQFSPFAALTGYEEAIVETGRLTDVREEISETRKEELDRVIHGLLEILDTAPRVRLTYFIPDLSKEGGSYVTREHTLRKVDLYRRELWSTDGERIPMDDIWSIEPV